MDDETYYRLRRAIKAADEGRTKDLGDFAQHAEEPPWRAELLEALERAVEHWYHSTDEDLLDVLQPHIKAAEQRGRAAGAREIADHLESIDPIEFALGSVDAVAEACRLAAEAERKAES